MILSRRGFLQSIGITATSIVVPKLWIPENKEISHQAQSNDPAFSPWETDGWVLKIKVGQGGFQAGDYLKPDRLGNAVKTTSKDKYYHAVALDSSDKPGDYATVVIYRGVI